MASEKKPQINGTETELNLLFKEALDGIRDDLNEATSNAEMYLEAIVGDGSGTAGKELYGQIYNQALSIKGQARDRQLKFLNMFKDRVSKKEVLQLQTKDNKTTDINIDHSQMNDLVKSLKEKINNEDEVKIPQVKAIQGKIEPLRLEPEFNTEDEFEIDDEDGDEYEDFR